MDIGIFKGIHIPKAYFCRERDVKFDDERNEIFKLFYWLDGKLIHTPLMQCWQVNCLGLIYAHTLEGGHTEPGGKVVISWLNIKQKFEKRLL